MSPSPDGERRVSKYLNFVHNDEIWKDHVRHEVTSQLQKWPERWGYLVREYESLTRVLRGDPALPSLAEVEQPRVTARIKLPPIGERRKILPERGYPTTTSQEVGWKSARNENTLTHYERAFDSKPKNLYQLPKLQPIDSAM